MLAAEMPGIPWQSGVALAFDVGADTVMAEWEAAILQNNQGAPSVQSLSPDEAWAML